MLAGHCRIAALIMQSRRTLVDEVHGVLADILGEHVIDIISVKVGTADEAFEVKIVCGSHVIINLSTSKLPLYNR